MKHFFLFGMVIFFSIQSIQAQRLSKEQVQDTVLPSFTAYKHNYFITGIPTHTGINETTADIKYQVSFKQLVTRRRLPLDIQLYFTYAQKAFWNIYEFSSPYREVNFNPGFGMERRMFNKNDQFTGIIEFRYEHESNGRDSSNSRGWNHFSLGYHTRLSEGTLLSIKTWLPFAYESNPDLIEYIGYGELNLSFEIDKNWSFDVTARKGSEWDLKGNLRTRLYFKVFERTNQHIMLEWFTGYGESLMAYDQYKSMIRIGYVIKSRNLDLLKGKRRKR